jgi:hypothetical protein
MCTLVNPHIEHASGQSGVWLLRYRELICGATQHIRRAYFVAWREAKTESYIGASPPGFPGVCKAFSLACGKAAFVVLLSQYGNENDTFWRNAATPTHCQLMDIHVVETALRHSGIMNGMGCRCFHRCDGVFLISCIRFSAFAKAGLTGGFHCVSIASHLTTLSGSSLSALCILGVGLSIAMARLSSHICAWSYSANRYCGL